MARAGFEPAKAEPTDLQSVPFGRSGISPLVKNSKKYENKDIVFFNGFQLQIHNKTIFLTLRVKSRPINYSPYEQSKPY